MIAASGESARPMIGATIRPSTTQAAIVRMSTVMLVRCRPTIVMKPAAPTSAATMNTPSGQWELKLKIAPISFPPTQSRNGSTTATAR
jgi:hypothetical protein